MIHGALVIEGGAMRSLYAAGILDVLLENKMEFSYVIGSSAGTLVAANYIAKHIGRSLRINVLHANDPNYFGLRHYIKSKGNIFNFSYLYQAPINDLYPYNTDALNNSKQRFIITATNCETGFPVYFEKRTYDEITKALTASCSLPLITKIVDIDGCKCLDGGIATPVAIHKAIEDGNQKIVVILTRDSEYKKNELSPFVKAISKVMYKQYPALLKSLFEMPRYYNKLKDEIISLEKDGKIFVVRPKKPLAISRTERDARKLLSAYFLGRDDMYDSMDKMMAYIGV